MSLIIHYTSCPLCNSEDFHSTLSVKDYTVSEEVFELIQCNNCNNRFTQNIATEAEIGKYYQSENYISHSDTKKDFISKIYHSVRNITLVSKRKLIEKSVQQQKGKLLDIGAGTGAFANTMIQAGWNVTALEPDEQARKKALENYKLQLQPTSDLFNFPAREFDAITMWHVMEHVHDLHGYFEKFKNIIKPAGKIFIAVPNYTSFDASYYQQYWAGYDVPRHLYHFSPHGMKQIAQQHGLFVSKTKPMWFDSVYVSLLSEKCKSGHSNFIKALFIGFLSNLQTLFYKEKCSSVIYILQKQV
ncbi:MAG: class I SAM-dependent methyltransferase [Chitinophagaceae bacterium]|nr:class I SAM-dependent methyltransferase [Chitinophagaceae bacterium]